MFCYISDRKKAPIEYDRAGYLKVQAYSRPMFERKKDKNEANVKPEMEGTVKIGSKKSKYSEPNAFEAQINSRVKPPTMNDWDKPRDPGNFPKFTFESKEMYEQAKDLSQKIPVWSTQKENPIY